MDASDLGPELGALALAKSLFPYIKTVEDMDEFLLFPPDLFAFTSLILTTTGAYRLIVSPPKSNDKYKEQWMPTEDEYMQNFCNFNEDDFKDILGLVNQLFIVENHKVSEFLRSQMDVDTEAITTLYHEINKCDKDQKEYLELEKKLSDNLSDILNSIVNGGSLYEKAKALHEEFKQIDPNSRNVFHNTNLSTEFWELLNLADKRDDVVIGLSRLLLDASYPNEIETSVTWDKRVRKAGLAWRKNLQDKFDDNEIKSFENLKRRAKINEYEVAIEILENFENMISRRNDLKNKEGENGKNYVKKNAQIANAISLTGRDEVALNDKKTRNSSITILRTKLRREFRKRSEIICKTVSDDKYVPKILKRYWDNFKAEVSPIREGNIRDILCEMEDGEERKDHWQRFISLVSLHAIADEACAGWGIRGPLKFLQEGIDGDDKSIIQVYAESRLKKFGSLSTVSKDRCRVLPKRHTAEVGITLRSISCNLGFHRSSVEVKWKLEHTEKPIGATTGNKPLTALNVLLLPIPLEIHTTDFKKRDVPVKSHQRSQDFFEYNPEVFGVKIKYGKTPDFSTDKDSLSNKFVKRIIEILDKAKNEVGRVDLVVLPELAIDENAIKFFENALLADKDNPVTAYIAGVRETEERFNRNAVYFKIAEKDGDTWKFKDKKEDYVQYKHHRWKLDRSQIIQYQLGAALSPTKNWWEAIKIGNREVNFINIGEKLTVCPLICEDLARQDPISDLIRTVGPTLVVAILMDGPQILQRWAGKYASVLGDDPGSAVITLTSYGMVKRSFAQGQKPSRIVALWSSPEAKTEIELVKDSEAILLSLSVDERKEKSSDGRVEMSGTPSLSLAGTIQIKTGNPEDAKNVLRC